MNFILSIIPFLISLLIGYLLITVLLSKEEKTDPFIHFFLAGGLGLGLSAFITFLGYVLFDQLNRGFVISFHLIFLAVLMVRCYIAKHFSIKLPELKNLKLQESLPFLAVLLAFIPLWMMAQLYPYGGWDAWSVWNFKSKFLFTGGEHWKAMFAPDLWRSSPHYPLLLPMVNVWGWIFLKNPHHLVPLLTSLFFTFFTGGLLFAAIRPLTKGFIAVLAPLAVITIPFFAKLAISQYSDIVFGYYLLAGLIALVLAFQQNRPNFALLSGIFLGLLGFSKSEGLVAALMVMGWTVPYFLWRSKNGKKQLMYFFAGAIIALIPSIIFKFLYSPGNQTFVNGFISSTKPSDMYRFKTILIFLLFELKHAKWHFLWIVLGLGLILSGRKSFARSISILPAFIISYLGVVLVYYHLNTYFEILWWLQVSLHRILFAVLPAFILWTFYALWGDQKRA